MAATDPKARVNDALENGSLAGALGRFNEAYVASRARAYEGIDFEALRDQLVGLKGRAAAHLDELAEQFEEKATQAGARVFRTSDPAEAKQYLARLCKENGVRRIAKSKSMVSEEMHSTTRSKRRASRWSRPTWASLSSSWPANRPRTSWPPSSTAAPKTSPSCSRKSLTCRRRSTRR